MTLDIKSIQVICFDLDGTISDTDDVFVQRLSKYLKPFRLFLPDHDPIKAARWLVMASETPGNYLFGIPDKLGIDHWLAKISDKLYEIGINKSEHPFLIIPGVTDTLKTLKDSYPLVIISARGARNTERFLNEFGLNKYFNFVVTSQSCQHTKPFPDQILWVAKQFNIPPSACLMIGDTTVDIIAAKSAGAQSVGVLCGFGERVELIKAGADMIIGTTSELTEILHSDKSNFNQH